MPINVSQILSMSIKVYKCLSMSINAPPRTPYDPIKVPKISRTMYGYRLCDTPDPAPPPPPQHVFPSPYPCLHCAW
jgi:hypothetical protein